MKINPTTKAVDFLQEYEQQTDPFYNETPKDKLIKHIIWDHLSYNERLIFLIYVECQGRYAKILEYIKVDSKRNLGIYISTIKRKIKILYNEHSKLSNYNNNNSDDIFN